MAVDRIALAANLRTLAPLLVAVADEDDPQAGPVAPYTGPLGAHLAWEGAGNTFTLTTPQLVAYGPSTVGTGPYVARQLPAGTYPVAGTFGGDPAPGHYKAVFGMPA